MLRICHLCGSVSIRDSHRRRRSEEARPKQTTRTTQTTFARWREASRLIESRLLKIPIPVLYFSETEEAKFEIIDGHQRIRSIARFMTNEFALNGLAVPKDFHRTRFHQGRTAAAGAAADRATPEPTDPRHAVKRALRTPGCRLRRILRASRSVSISSSVSSWRSLSSWRSYVSTSTRSPGPLQPRAAPLGTPLRNFTSITTCGGPLLSIAPPVFRRCAGSCTGRVRCEHADRARHLRAALMRVAFEHPQRRPTANVLNNSQGKFSGDHR